MNKNRFFFVIILILTIAFVLIIFFFNLNDLATILGLGIGASGLLFSAWQILQSQELAQQSIIKDLKTELLNEMMEIRTSSDKRDFYHEQQLSRMNQEIASLRSQLEHHQSLIGHQGTIEQLLLVKDQIADLRALVAATARNGEILRKLERLQTMVNKLYGLSPLPSITLNPNLEQH